MQSDFNSEEKDDSLLPQWTQLTQALTILNKTDQANSTQTQQSKNVADKVKKCRSGVGVASKTIYNIDGVPNGICIENNEVDTPSVNERTILQKLGDISTTALVNVMFATTTQFQSYLIKFVQCVAHRVDPYVSEHNLQDTVHLVFKGGNVLHDYFYQLLGNRTVAMPNNLSEMLQRSDADFQFHIDNSIHEQHSDPLRRLVAASLYDFLSVLKETSDLPTDAAFLKPTRDSVKNYKAAFKIFSVVREAKCNNRSDFMVLSPSNTLSKHVLGEQNQGHLCDILYLPMPTLLGGPFFTELRPPGTFVSLNDTVKFTDIREQTTAFDLMRIKFNIDVTLVNGCVYHAPAELIDVTFSNKDDSRLIHSQGKAISEWTQIRTFHDSDVHVRIPTLKYLVHDDLAVILFKQGNFPWDAPKYKKRLARFVVGCFLLSMDDNLVVNTEASAKRWAWKCDIVNNISIKTLSRMTLTVVSTVNAQPQSTTALSFQTNDPYKGVQSPVSVHLKQRIRNSAQAQFSSVVSLVEDVRQNVADYPGLHANYTSLVQSIIETSSEMNRHLKNLVDIRTTQLKSFPEDASVFQSLFTTPPGGIHRHSQELNPAHSLQQ